MMERLCERLIISSSHYQRAYYDLTIKAVPDGFVSLYLLEDVKVGDRLSSTGPMGGFFHNPLSHSNEVVYLANHSGIIAHKRSSTGFVA